MSGGKRSQLHEEHQEEELCLAGGEEPNLQDAQATAGEEDEYPCSSFAVSGSTSPTSSTVGFPWKCQRVQPTCFPDVDVSCKYSDAGDESEVEECSSSSSTSPFLESLGNDPLATKVGMLVDFLLYKYKIKEPIKKAEMLKMVPKKSFPQILWRAAEHLDVFFGLCLKEIDPFGHTYAFVSNLDPSNEESVDESWDFSLMGLLMPILGVIFMNGSHASEEDMWQFLNVLGIYEGKKHPVFGDPRKLITEDLVQEKYLEYRQVPNSDPPYYEFLWGQKAHAQISKMKVLEYLAKVNGTVPGAYQSQYEDALRSEEEQIQARIAARLGTSDRASTQPSRSSQV
ncbi:PREDICTED: melanoma-associated antigen B2-like [Dipodomys ordii]|uniref:Melanoma-associated antigen B2-like n=1 Tax=Dipodomys ordii TaxID=10020 RepID=A0A1S3GHS7_DIPOR|nr:PREDICTED: melanoma-associated antigen B2-like [Dipodomys ordii]